MSHGHESFMPELGGLIKRSLARVNESHVHELVRVLEAALLAIHPNERRHGRVSLDIFTSKSVETMNAFLHSVREFVLGIHAQPPRDFSTHTARLLGKPPIDWQIRIGQWVQN